MEAPEMIYLDSYGSGFSHGFHTNKLYNNDIEYTRTNAFIDRIINFLNYKLDDIIAIRVPGTIIPHHIAKQELIDDLKKYMKEE